MNTSADGIPQRRSLVAQTIKVIKAGIDKNFWHEWLPGERVLSEAMQVSRTTLRRAIRALEEEGVLRAAHPFGTRIVAEGTRPARREGKTFSVGLLVPVPLVELRPKVAVAIDELRELLGERGYRLRLFHSGHYFTSGAFTRLERLVTSNPHDCWVLLRAQEKTKQWFHDRGVPAVVLGTCVRAARLPFVDLDYRRICRHATTQLIKLGHERIVLLIGESTRGGDIASIEGFQEALAGRKNNTGKGRAIRVHFSYEAMHSLLKRLFARTLRPTALLLPDPYYYLLAMTYLRDMGLRIPRDVSLLCRSDDIFLEYITPRPTRYLFDSSAFSRSLFDLIIRTINKERNVAGKSVLIMPRFEPGATIGPPGGKQWPRSEKTKGIAL
ncbi:MAG: substrate-binding domain-containing protein [Opitutaceae bacterium]|nr:substrate-binding domain-containing protein [Opitutaceae bacterium]